MLKSSNFVAVLAALSIFFALPVSGDDYVLNIFGNANLDGTIDQDDAAYIKSIIDGVGASTDLADANFDGQIDEADVSKVQDIINGTESSLTVLDGNGKPITIGMPVERVVVEYLDNADMMQILKQSDLVVGVDLAVANSGSEFPELSERANVGAMHKEPDYEKVLSLDPDVLLTFSNVTSEKEKNLPGVSVLFAGLYYPDLLNPQTSAFTDAVRKMGYILEARDEAEDYLKWHIGSLDQIRSSTDRVPESDRPTVLVAAYPESDEKTIFTFASIDTLTNMVLLAGGNPVAADLPDFLKSTYRIEVDPEWVIEQNPDYIVLLVVATTYSGLELDPPSGYDADDPTGIAAAREAFMSRPEYSNLTAVRNGDVYIMSGNMRNDATKGLIGAAYLAEIFHPQEMDLDPEELHREYVQKFLGLDYDLDQHGVFIYPPLVVDGRVEGVPDQSYELSSENRAA